MMNPVHVRGDDEQPQRTIEPRDETQVGVVEHGAYVQQHLEQEHGQRGCPEGADGGELEQHRGKDLRRMKARTRGDVYIEVGMMHAVQAPQKRHSVKDHMLQIDGEVQQEDSDGDRQRGGERPDGMEQSPASLLRAQGHADGSHRQRRAEDDRIEDHEGDVRGPSPSTGDRTVAAGEERLRGCQQNEDRDERT